MEKDEIQMHKETCYCCGYEGYDEDSEVSKRNGCPKCGAKKMHTVLKGQEPMTVIVPKKDALMDINLEGLEDKWSLTSHENCCDCGMNFEDNDEVPMRFWRNAESPDCTELALCWSCGKKRMKPNTKER